jgi:FAD/FMN-containing dehydrogenase
MAGAATIYTEQSVLEHTLGIGPAMPVVAAVWIGLALATPPPSSITPGHEVVGTNYARQPITFSVSGNVAINSEGAQYTTAGSYWGVIGWFEIWDALVGGNRLYFGPLVDPADGVTPITREILVGDVMRFQASTITVSAT